MGGRAERDVILSQTCEIHHAIWLKRLAQEFPYWLLALCGQFFFKEKLLIANCSVTVVYAFFFSIKISST